MAIYGYGRYRDTADKEEVYVELSEYGCNHIYLDKNEKYKLTKPEFDSLVRAVGRGDTVVVKSLLDLAITNSDLLASLNKLFETGADLESMAEPWANTTEFANYTRKMYLLEKESLSNRIRQGMKVAVANGANVGAPKIDNDIIEMAIELYKSGEMKVPQILEITQISKSTLYRELRKRDMIQK